MSNGLSLAEEAEKQLRWELHHTRQRLAEALDESFIHRQNYERAIAFLAFFAPPDVTEIVSDRLFREWIESVK